MYSMFCHTFGDKQTHGEQLVTAEEVTAYLPHLSLERLEKLYPGESLCGRWADDTTGDRVGTWTVVRISYAEPAGEIRKYEAEILEAAGAPAGYYIGSIHPMNRARGGAEVVIYDESHRAKLAYDVSGDELEAWATETLTTALQYINSDLAEGLELDGLLDHHAGLFGIERATLAHEWGLRGNEVAEQMGLI